jgi:hypothetical protein
MKLQTGKVTAVLDASYDDAGLAAPPRKIGALMIGAG